MLNLGIKTLSGVAAVGGFFVVGSAHFFQNRILDNLRSCTYYRESLTILKSHKGLVNLLGEPILEGKVDLGNREENFSTGTEAQFKVPLKGKKEKGELFIWASKEDSKKCWEVNRLELAIESQPNKRVRIIPKLSSGDQQEL